MHTTFSSVLLHTLSCFAALPAAHALAVGGPPPNAASSPAPSRDQPDKWKPYSKSIFLPFVYEFTSTRTPQVYGSILGTTFEFPVDTGSTGVIIGAPKLPDIPLSNGKPGYEFLDSSSLLYVGTYVNVSITFKGEQGVRAISRVPVLIVNEAKYCPTYKPGKDTDKCPDKKAKKVPAKDVIYLGVGFGRNTEESGETGTPDYNPFLNVQSVNGKRVNESNFRTGYTIGKAGVNLGLTLDNTDSYAWTDLDKGASEDGRDWAMVNMSFTVNDQGNYKGKALIDSGVSQMYIQSMPEASLPNITVKDPLNPKSIIKTVKPGTKLEIGFPEIGPTNIGGYAFKVGNNIFPSQPYFVQAVGGGPGPFVNTGRKFLYGFDVAFDAEGGKFGIKCKLCSSGESTKPSHGGKPKESAKPGAKPSAKKEHAWEDEEPDATEGTSMEEEKTREGKQSKAWKHDDSWKKEPKRKHDWKNDADWETPEQADADSWGR